METVMDFPNVLSVLFTKERSNIPRITTGYMMSSAMDFSPWEQNRQNGVPFIPE